MQPGMAPIVKSKMAMETSTSGDRSSKKNHGKIPKKIRKAEREKMKREHFNELFLALANSVDLSEQNNGKASVLIEATRIVKDMLAQIECLKKDNTALLSESKYITVETNELKEETSALEGEIGKLQTVINSKVSELQLGPPEFHNSDCLPIFPPQGQIVSPLNLATFCSNVQFDSEQLSSKNIPVVCKPHARYPSPSDNWPSQVLEK